MCDIVTAELKPGHWDITCKKSGKPITVSNENGMYCEDMCDEDKDIKAGAAIQDLMDLFNKIGF